MPVRSWKIGLKELPLKRKRYFFEKKVAKNFDSCGPWQRRRQIPQDQKFLGYFFSKK
jgi:hypothetical protein